MSVNIRNMSVEELADLKASMFVYERQLTAEIALHRAEVERREALLVALTDDVVLDGEEPTTEEATEGFSLYLSESGRKKDNGQTSYALSDDDDNVIAHLIGKGRSWRVTYQGKAVGHGSSKQAAINDFVEAMSA